MPTLKLSPSQLVVNFLLYASCVCSKLQNITFSCTHLREQATSADIQLAKCVCVCVSHSQCHFHTQGDSVSELANVSISSPAEVSRHQRIRATDSVSHLVPWRCPSPVTSVGRLVSTHGPPAAAEPSSRKLPALTSVWAEQSLSKGSL